MGITQSFLLIALFLTFSSAAEAWGNDRVKLSDISTLTLHQGRSTTGRRTNPVPQLKCIGGSAGCSASSQIKSVQCYNKGSDGSSVQWECKANMPKNINFGAIEVLCEGYDHSNDPYILKGSCGLEYQLEGTGKSQSYFQNVKTSSESSSGFSDLLLIAVVALIIYALYKTCLSSSQRSPTSDDYDNGPGYPDANYRGFPTAPSYPGGSCNQGSSSGYSRGVGGNFWTGAATGGILGYMFGSRGSSSTGYSGYAPNYSSGHSSFSTSSDNGSGTHESSGYGGTRMR